MQCVFLAHAYEKAHHEALGRRRQLHRQELQKANKFGDRLSVTLFGLDYLRLPTPSDGWQHIGTTCQLCVHERVLETTRCTTDVLFWDQEFDFEVS
jgi:hypothetical protein